MSTKVLCLSHVHVPVQYKLTKCLVEPRPDPQLQGTDLALKAEPGQYSLTSQQSDQKLEPVSSAFILDPWDERNAGDVSTLVGAELQGAGTSQP